jgi:hypothetical protein
MHTVIAQGAAEDGAGSPGRTDHVNFHAFRCSLT